MDECLTENGGCEHICVNTNGGYNLHIFCFLIKKKIFLYSFRCECPSNKQLSRNSQSCVDLDSCDAQNNGGCEHLCEERNKIFYRCRCRTGYFLDSTDKRSCYRKKQNF